MKMKYFDFLVEFVDEKGEKSTSRKTVTSNHLSGAIRKLYQSYDGVNLIRIF